MARPRKQPAGNAIAARAQFDAQVQAELEHLRKENADLTALRDQQTMVLANQLAFARNHFFALAQRFAAVKVEANQMNWDQGGALINGELAQFDAQLRAIAEQGA